MRLLVVAALGALACSEPSPDMATNSCPGGGAPALTDCSRGLYHADCGGDGAPVLACGPNCVWFQGGCPAAGFVPIDCPTGDPFCVTTEDGQWPFVDEVEFEGTDVDYPEDWYFGSIFCDDLDQVGDAVVTATSGMNLTVTIDPAVTAPESPTAECDGLSLGLCTTDGMLFVESPTFSTHNALLFVRDGGFGGDRLALEIGSVGGAFAGRAFARRDTDYWGWGRDCETYLDQTYGTEMRPIFVDGEIVLSNLSVLHGTATLRTADGGVLTLTF